MSFVVACALALGIILFALLVVNPIVQRYFPTTMTDPLRRRVTYHIFVRVAVVACLVAGVLAWALVSGQRIF